MNRLLLDEKPLMVLPQFAAKIGLNNAIIIQQIHYWLVENRIGRRNLKDGRYWTYNSYDDWAKQFPFWSASTVKRAFTSLKKSGLIIVEQKSDDPYNKTNWYTIDYDELEKQTGESDAPGQSDPIDTSQADPMLIGTTETSTETNITPPGENAPTPPFATEEPDSLDDWGIERKTGQPPPESATRRTADSVRENGLTAMQRGQQRLDDSPWLTFGVSSYWNNNNIGRDVRYLAYMFDDIFGKSMGEVKMQSLVKKHVYAIRQCLEYARAAGYKGADTPDIIVNAWREMKSGENDKHKMAMEYLSDAHPTVKTVAAMVSRNGDTSSAPIAGDHKAGFDV